QNYWRRSLRPRALCAFPCAAESVRELPGKPAKCRRTENNRRQNRPARRCASLRSALQIPRGRANQPSLTSSLAVSSASSLVTQNPTHGLAQIFHDHIRPPRPFLRVPGLFSAAVSAAHENCFAARGKCQLHIAITISHNKRAVHINVVLPYRLFDHTRGGLAA